MYLTNEGRHYLPSRTVRNHLRTFPSQHSIPCQSYQPRHPHLVEFISRVVKLILFSFHLCEFSYRLSSRVGLLPRKWSSELNLNTYLETWECPEETLTPEETTLPLIALGEILTGLHQMVAPSVHLWRKPEALTDPSVLPQGLPFSCPSVGLSSSPFQFSF